MRFIIDFNKEKTIEYLETSFRDLVRFLYQWISTDGEVLGYILGIWHVMVCITIFISIIISHTIYPSFWFQLGVFISMFAIWIQHIFLQVCVVFVAEITLTNNEPPLVWDVFFLKYLERYRYISMSIITLDYNETSIC